MKKPEKKKDILLAPGYVSLRAYAVMASVNKPKSMPKRPEKKELWKLKNSDIGKDDENYCGYGLSENAEWIIRVYTV